MARNAATGVVAPPVQPPQDP
ncbi:hypothetical protein A2U01_0116224, partial [Trifolium medium]|nr:hypothetical protein [Trifolium medium]